MTYKGNTKTEEKKFFFAFLLLFGKKCYLCLLKSE